MTSPETAESIAARLERLPFTRIHWRVASILGTGTFFDAFDSLAIGIVLTVVAVTFHAGFVTAGLLISGGYLGQFIGAIAFGFVAERWGRKPAFLWSLAIFGFFSLLAALATSFNALLVSRTLQGIGLGAEVPVAGALFSEFLRGKTRGRIVLLYESLFAWGFLAAPVIGTMVFGLVGPNAGWRVLFWLGAIPLVVAIIGCWALPESPRWLAHRDRLADADHIVSLMEKAAVQRVGELPEPVLGPSIDKRPTSVAELFSTLYLPRTILCWMHWFITYFVTYGYSVWLPLLYVRVGGLPPSEAIALTIIPAAGQVVMSYTVAQSIDKLGRKVWFAGGYAVGLMAMITGVILTAAGHRNWQVLFGVCLITTLGNAVNAIGVILYTPELFPTRLRALATSGGSAANRIASIIAPLCVGALLDAGLGIGSVFAMFALALLIGFLVIVQLGQETSNRTLEELSP